MVRARRRWLLGLPLAAAAVAVFTTTGLRPWHEHAPAEDDVRLEAATLSPGQVELVVVNDSGEPARVAQVILNDAFVDFHQTRRVLSPGGSGIVIVSYPWVRGESYEVELMTATGATVGHEIEDAEGGLQAA
jgi:zinc transporter, ZIP family